MTRIGIVVGSTRPGRRGRAVAEWVASVAAQEQPEADFEIVDLADFALPLLDEEQPALFGRYGNAHTVRFAEAVSRYDGFVFVTPEYNHSIPGALKNALDFVYAEWNNKAAGFVGYGLHGATRAVEHLRLILAELRVATVRTQVALSLHHDFTFSAPTEPGAFTPGAHQHQTLSTLLADVVVWSRALQPVREGALA
ncbi:NADPH-dependent FMN reductase [Nonomuraea rhodomycinica]|uniref:NAD(P)H-dependent oxidoreductase n=1 Tax=Nonomuraea rhodomycinica TaxID=1712872 RepID=A0A7Y6IIN6_9ACTN|nr:NAD(P)H-dependent oxidoreductase [Nonomuraea rhodomycinica]NUW38832.1 NAD(P)H-dependent oxidoreductase [Nonomuraea rhodomycinica]